MLYFLSDMHSHLRYMEKMEKVRYMVITGNDEIYKMNQEREIMKKNKEMCLRYDKTKNE